MSEQGISKKGEELCKLSCMLSPKSITFRDIVRPKFPFSPEKWRTVYDFLILAEKNYELKY